MADEKKYVKPAVVPYSKHVAQKWRDELARAIFDWLCYANEQDGTKHASYELADPTRNIPEHSTRKDGWLRAVDIVTRHFSNGGTHLYFCGSSCYDPGAGDQDESEKSRQKVLGILRDILSELKEAKQEFPHETNGRDFHAARGALDCTIKSVKEIVQFVCDHDYGDDLHYEPGDRTTGESGSEYWRCDKCGQQVWVNEEGEEWGLNAPQVEFMLQHHNPINNAYASENMDYSRQLVDTERYRELFGDMSFDEAYSRYESMSSL